MKNGVKCYSCESQVMPRVVFRRSVFRGGKAVPVESICPVCLARLDGKADGTVGIHSFIGEIVDLFAINPLAGIIAVFLGIPMCLIGLVILLLAVLEIPVGILLLLKGVPAGEVLSQVGPMLFMGFIVLCVILYFAHIPFTLISIIRAQIHSRKK
ncbi:MAG: hypothetical protein KAI85_10115 [Halopseudomonas aestusnigri]|nr:hypothetical protein [Halopseudomonas aestusnigri]